MEASHRQLVEWRGRVVDVNGAPVPNAQIVIVGSAVPLPEIALLSDANANFSVRLPPGSFTLRAHGPHGSTGEVEVQEGLKTNDVVITIHSNPGIS